MPPPRPEPPPQLPQSPWQWNPNKLWLVILALTALFWLRDLWVTSNQVQPIPYSEFLQHLKADRL